MAGLVSVSWRERACTVSLDRAPVGNALSPELVEHLHEALNQAIEKKAALLILTGEGRHFCTGFDLAGLEFQDDSALLHRFVRIEMLLSRVYSAPFVTLAYAGGAALGAGADLYAACSLRFSSASARFAFPGSGFGLLLGTRRLAERVGATAAQELVLSGRSIDADEAASLGLTRQIVEPDAIACVIERETLFATRLEAQTTASVRRVLSRTMEDSDLADLVRSAARPGLRERILGYRARLKRESVSVAS